MNSVGLNAVNEISKFVHTELPRDGSNLSIRNFVLALHSWNGQAVVSMQRS